VTSFLPGAAFRAVPYDNMQKAEAAVADDATLSARVRRERLPLDNVWLSRYGALKVAAKLRQKPFLGPEDPRAATEEFIRVCGENGVGNWRERYPFAERAEALRSKFGRPAEPPEQTKGLDASQWIDIQDSQFRLHTDHGWAKRVEDPAASDMGGNRFCPR